MVALFVYFQTEQRRERGELFLRRPQWTTTVSRNTCTLLQLLGAELLIVPRCQILVLRSSLEGIQYFLYIESIYRVSIYIYCLFFPDVFSVSFDRASRGITAVPVVVVVGVACDHGTCSSLSTPSLQGKAQARNLHVLEGYQTTNRGLMSLLKRRRAPARNWDALDGYYYHTINTPTTVSTQKEVSNVTMHTATPETTPATSLLRAGQCTTKQNKKRRDVLTTTVHSRRYPNN